MVLGKDIEETRKTLPSVFKGIDDALFLVFGQFPEYVRQKQEIKHKKLLEDYKEKIYNEVSKIPREQISNPDISILGPSLESSKFFTENETLRSMFSKVAASSVDKRLKNYSRSAFVEFIKQLSPLDIKLLYILKSNIQIKNPDKNNSSNDISIPTDKAVPLVDVSIKSGNTQNYYKRNVVPNEICRQFNCSIDEVASSIDNLSRMGIIKIRNNHLINWRFKKSTEWFKDNTAINGAYNSINKEISDIKKNIYDENNPEEGYKFENGQKVHYKNINVFINLNNESLEEQLSTAKDKEVVINQNKMIELTSLGSDFSEVCM